MKKILQHQVTEIINMYNNGLGSDTIGKHFNVTSTCILKILKKNGIERRDFTRKLGNKHEEIIKLYQEGYSSPEIAEQLNVTHGAILKILKKNNIERRDDEECRRKYPINKDFFDIIDTQEKAYFLGFLYADGCNHINANMISLNLAEKDKEILYKLSKMIYLENTDDKVKIYDRSSEGTNKGKFATITINSKYICNKLNDLGLTSKKSLTLTFPECIKDEELIRHFIRGYFDGDGSIKLSKEKGKHKLKQGSITIISTLEFCNTISNFVKSKINIKFGIKNAVANKNCFTIYFAGSRQTRKFMEWLYKDSTIYLERKYLIYLELLDNINKIDKLILAGTQGFSKRYYNT